MTAAAHVVALIASNVVVGETPSRLPPGGDVVSTNTIVEFASWRAAEPDGVGELLVVPDADFVGVREDVADFVGVGETVPDTVACGVLDSDTVVENDEPEEGVGDADGVNDGVKEGVIDAVAVALGVGLADGSTTPCT